MLCNHDGGARMLKKQKATVTAVKEIHVEKVRGSSLAVETTHTDSVHFSTMYEDLMMVLQGKLMDHLTYNSIYLEGTMNV